MAERLKACLRDISAKLISVVSSKREQRNLLSFCILPKLIEFYWSANEKQKVCRFTRWIKRCMACAKQRVFMHTISVEYLLLLRK